jgi:hypothetical protein
MRSARFIFAVCFALALYSAPGLAQGPAASGPGLESKSGPLAEVPERLHDFGDMVDWKEYTYAFVVKNVGTAPLEIKKVIKV